MRLSKLLYTSLLVIIVPLMTGCQDIIWAAQGQPNVFNGYKEKPVPPKEPGLYGSIDEWNNGRSEINGEVGHPILVQGPQAECVNTLGQSGSGNWNGRSRIDSGKLPPGLTLVSGDDIKGIPTERGHWVVGLKFDNIQCNGNYFPKYAFSQQLIFHITGTGQVVQ